MSIPLLPTHPVRFPDPESALVEPDGLLAAGGALNVPWLTEAYGRGIFPWFNSDDDFILWWSPARRATLAPGKMKVSRSLNKKIRQADFEVRVDCNFDA
ncbi:MAG: leucyl/phenylalanyl-tRNA--protein transferase, partial [Pseudomonadota bacterium]|nr:leucyl/phenylalanyl-tRNA--protein transferase [Pseudomonadota bacterium]